MTRKHKTIESFTLAQFHKLPASDKDGFLDYSGYNQCRHTDTIWCDHHQTLKTWKCHGTISWKRDAKTGEVSGRCRLEDHHVVAPRKLTATVKYLLGDSDVLPTRFAHEWAKDERNHDWKAYGRHAQS